MHTNWRAEVPQLLLLVGMFVAAVAAWPFVPERLPVHWNLHGEIDRYGGKIEGLLAIPLIASAAYVLLLVLPKFDPARANYASFESSYFVIRLSLLLATCVSYGCILMSAFGRGAHVGSIICWTIGLLLIVLGNVMGKIRPNWFVGVRTPWTLSSRRSWNKTHRLAGRLFVAMGLLIGACGFVQTPWLIAAAAIGSVISPIWMVVYSYLIWRDDPEQQSPASITPSQNEN